MDFEFTTAILVCAKSLNYRATLSTPARVHGIFVPNREEIEFTL